MRCRAIWDCCASMFSNPPMLPSSLSSKRKRFSRSAELKLAFLCRCLGLGGGWWFTLKPPHTRLQALSRLKFWETCPCILVTGRGMPDIATRFLKRELAMRLATYVGAFKATSCLFHPAQASPPTTDIFCIPWQMRSPTCQSLAWWTGTPMGQPSWPCTGQCCE